VLPNGPVGRLVYVVIAVIAFGVAGWSLLHGPSQGGREQLSGAWPVPLVFATCVTFGLAALSIALTVPDKG
jgi:hypothetical protein